MSVTGGAILREREKMHARQYTRPLLAALFILSAGYVTQANAVPVFNIDNNGGFLQGSENPAIIDFSEPKASPPSPANTFRTIEWISGSSPQSMLNVDTVGDTTVDAEGGPVVISTLTHNNAVIPGGTTWTITARSNFQLLDPTDTTVLVDLPNSDEMIAFLETTNDGSCNDQGLNGVLSNNLVGSNCDDMYDVLLADFAGDNQIFGYNGQNYLLTFGLLPGLGTDFEFITGADGFDYIRVYAGEDGESVFNVTVEVTRVVPVPGSLALMGIGLTGLGFGAARARKRKQNH
jgi:hypothetical protein